VLIFDYDLWFNLVILWLLIEYWSSFVKGSCHTMVIQLLKIEFLKCLS